MIDVDSIRINFSQDQLTLMNICLGFLMFGVALDMTIDDFRRVVKFPKSTMVGLISQLILLPILTILIIKAWGPVPSIALGMLLVGVCPGGNISNFATHLARGNAALSVTLTSIVTLAAIFVTPFSFQGWAHFLPETQPLLQQIKVNAWDMVKIIFQLILVPLIIGMTIHYYLPGFTARIRAWVKRLSLLIFFGFIVFALLGNISTIKNYLYIVLGLVFFHNSLAMVQGYYFAKLNRLPEADARAISLETGVQNSGLGLVLIFNFFPELGGMILVAAWWGVYDLISSFLVANYWARKRAPEAASEG
ncbi:MAG: bile acid:sodium symporter family protein [Saprospiraceae bacterium]|nr:bile acid:sodium symporter family protein [Saprospiraceae bacterium]MCB9320539.1 bile acid:sodium symporter family protein [Lewinellaceae bacterium]